MSPTARTQLKIEAGQIWESCDPRDNGRRLRVKLVDSRYAYCVGPNGRETRILLTRFKPNATGYRLVEVCDA